MQVSVAPPYWGAFLSGTYNITLGLPPDVKNAIDEDSTYTGGVLLDVIHAIPLINDFYNDNIHFDITGGLLLEIDSGNGNVKIATVDSFGNISPIQLPKFW